MATQRKSLRQHLVDGTIRADRLQASEPNYRIKAPAKPDYITARPDASQEWDRIVPILVDQHILTLADRAALIGYCTSYADVVQAERMKLTPDYQPVIASQTRHGTATLRPHPAIGTGIRSAQELRQWAAHLGLTPASRTKVSTTPPEAMSAIKAFAARRSPS